jgi:hypothetical protein
VGSDIGGDYRFNLFIVIQPDIINHTSISNSKHEYNFITPGIYLEVDSDTRLEQVELNFEDQYIKLNSGYLPVATATALGAVKIGENLNISEDGSISAPFPDWSNV